MEGTDMAGPGEERDYNGESTMTNRASSMARDTVERVTDAAEDAEQQLRSAAARKVRQAKELQDDMLDAVSDKLGKVDSYVKENPFTAAGIAFAIGAIVSALIRR
jgi:ElaB/YqjD/DUF883 family membrane-anchored ribosome-binding protein